MLSKLIIKNYALIDDLNVSFSKGFTTITGETGAGKSIFLGGLSLVLGKRADRTALRNQEQKCIIEAEFQIDQYALESFFKERELFYDPHTILRREIHPSGKSRAFINDSPVTLDILNMLGNRLIDIHSQHQTLLLADTDFQLKVVDALAGNLNLLKGFQEKLEQFRKTESSLLQLQQQQQTAIKEHDYNSFLLRELKEANLEETQQQSLEEEYEQLNNVEVIMQQLSDTYQLFHNEQIGLLQLLGQLKLYLNKLAGYGKQYEDLSNRVVSSVIEITDISDELELLENNISSDPKRLTEVRDQLQSIYDLQKKHGVSDVAELLSITRQLEKKFAITEDLEGEIERITVERDNLKGQLEKMAVSLSQKRHEVIPNLIKEMEEAVRELGMPNAKFRIVFSQRESFNKSGKDDLLLEFSANKGSDFGLLKKIASGGELSRIMLVIKSILARYEKLPTMMFDEIDTGVSGEISNKMGDIMVRMSEGMQIFAITHLPQVASKGDQHFKVFKDDQGQVTQTRMKSLNPEERIVELAEMLGGKSLSESAIAHAKQLLN